MAAHRPLIIDAGEVKRLPAGDTLTVPFSELIETSLVNDNAGSVVICAPVYIAAAGHFDKAKADAAGTSKVIGLVSDSSGAILTTATGTVGTDGLFTATTGQWDAVTGQTGGLTANTDYYLDAATAGKLTITAPTTTGQYVVYVGRAISTTDMKIEIARRILL